MEKILLDLVSKVDESLRFAETKNGALLALAGAGAVAILTFMSPGEVPPPWTTGLWFVVALLSLAALVSLLSFLPRQDQEKILATRMPAPGPTENLLFFGHLARHTPTDLLQAISTRYLGGNDKPHSASAYEIDLASQIIVLARITVLKLRYFTAATLLMTLAVISAAVVPLVLLALHR